VGRAICEADGETQKGRLIPSSADWTGLSEPLAAMAEFNVE
jgi:hypothetical protein